MAHEITDTDNMFSVRANTWHGLGVILPEFPTREEAQQIAHPWEPISEPVYLSEPHIDAETNTFEERFIEAPGVQALRRSDTGALLGVMSDTYEPVNNSVMWDIAESLEQGGQNVQYETGGSLAGGKKVWLMLRLNEPLVVNGDPRGGTIPYYALQNSHDGSSAFRGQAVMTRIVCANTSKMADLDARARGTEFTFRHTKNVHDRVEEAQQALTQWRSSLEDWKQLCELDLMPRKITRGDVGDFLHAFIPEPAADLISDRVRGNIEAERAKWMDVFNSVTCEGITGTAYGLVQASIEYSEHVKRARTNETRFKRTYLSRNDLTSRAVELAREVASL